MGDVYMKKHIGNNYLFWVLLSESVGFLSGWLSRNGIGYFQNNVLKPPFSPPAILFPVVWTILFAFMGVGAARISAVQSSKQRSCSLNLFILQLAVNFCWSIIFFNFQSYNLAFLWLLLLLGLVILMALHFYQTDKYAAFLQIPYLLWLGFAAYLNLGIWYLNR